MYLEDLYKCYSNFIYEYIILENLEEYKSLNLKFKLINEYYTDLNLKLDLKRNNIEYQRNINNNIKILNIIDDRIVLFKTQTMGLFDRLPEEILFNILDYLKQNQIDARNKMI